MQAIPPQSETCECRALREEMNAGFCNIMGILGSIVQTLQEVTHANANVGATPQQESSEDPNVGISEEGGFSFERLKATKGAIFDHLYSKLLSPKLVFEAFNVGYAGCPPIISMDSKISGYSGTWRFGRERYKKFYHLQIVYNDINKQPVGDRESCALTMHMKYTRKACGAISTLSKKITESHSIH